MTTQLKRCGVVIGLMASAAVFAPSSASAQNCAPGTELNGALCYPTCNSGYYGVGPVCWAYCRSGYDDHGATCYKSLFSWYAKHSYGRGAGRVPDWSPVTGDVADSELVRGVWEVGRSAYEAGTDFVGSIFATDWCGVGLELSRGVSSVLGQLGPVYGEIQSAQTSFLASVGVPSETVSLQSAADVFQPDLDNSLQQIINWDPGFGRTLVSLVETSRGLQLPPSTIVAAVCGDRGALGALQATAASLAQSAGGYVRETTAAHGWLGFVYTVIDAGGGLPANMQHSFGVLFKLAGDQGPLAYWTGAGGLMAGQGVSTSVRLVYIPFNVPRGDLLGHGWSLSGTGLFERLFTNSVGPWFSGNLERGAALPIEVVGNVPGTYAGFSFGPQIGVSTRADITLAYTVTVDLDSSGR